MKLQVGLGMRLYFVLCASIVLSGSQAFGSEVHMTPTTLRSDDESSEDDASWSLGEAQPKALLTIGPGFLVREFMSGGSESSLWGRQNSTDTRKDKNDKEESEVANDGQGEGDDGDKKEFLGWQDSPRQSSWISLDSSSQVQPTGDGREVDDNESWGGSQSGFLGSPPASRRPSISGHSLERRLEGLGDDEEKWSAQERAVNVPLEEGEAEKLLDAIINDYILLGVGESLNKEQILAQAHAIIGTKEFDKRIYRLYKNPRKEQEDSVCREGYVCIERDGVCIGRRIDGKHSSVIIPWPKGESREEEEGSEAEDSDNDGYTFLACGRQGEGIEFCHEERAYWRNKMKEFDAMVSEYDSHGQLSDQQKGLVGDFFRNIKLFFEKEGRGLLTIKKDNSYLKIDIREAPSCTPYFYYIKEKIAYIRFSEADGIQIEGLADKGQKKGSSGDSSAEKDGLGSQSSVENDGLPSQGLWSRFSNHIGLLCGTAAMFILPAKILSDGSEDSRMAAENSSAATSSLVDSSEEVSISGIDKALGHVEKVLDETGVDDSSQSKDSEVLGVAAEVGKVTAQDKLVLPGLGFMSDENLSMVKKTALGSVLAAGVLKLFHYCYSQYKKNSGLHGAKGKAQMWAKKALYYAQQYKKMTMATAGGLAVVGVYLLQNR